MSISAPTYSDPDRLVPFLPSERADTAAEAREAAKANAGAKKPLTAFAEGDDSPSFWDVLDVINPLQHIPVVNNIYREMTGDQIGVAARVAGGTLFGGPVGLVASAVDCMVEAETGDNMGGHALAMFRDPSPVADTAIASAEQHPAPQVVAGSSPSLAAVSLPEAGKAAEVPASGKGASSQAMAVALPDMVSSSQDLNRMNMAFGLDGSVNGRQASAPAPALAAVPSAGPARPSVHPAVAAAVGLPPSPSAVDPAVAAPVSRPSVDAVSGSAAMTQQAMLQPAKMMPVPERKSFQAGNGPAPVSVPVSGGASRSNVPVTGRDPVSSRTSAATNLSVQRAMAQQGLANNQHPMLPSADGSTRVNTGGSDWFTSAFNQAMDKYQKGSALGQQQAASQTTPAGNLY